MDRLLLTPRSITLLQEDGAELARWSWAERAEAVAALRDAGFADDAEFLENVDLFAPVEEQMELAEVA